MPTSVGWFICMAALSALFLSAGVWAGQGPRRRAALGLVLGFACLILWTWLHHHPAVAVNMIPPSMLAYLEGVGAVPFFMLIVGICWSMSRLPRQRKVMGFAMALGWLYFINGGLWMLQSTPTASFGRSITGGVVMQSQDYSCVAAACATALTRLGLPATEADMAEFTQTRPGTGATLIRAYEGLRLALGHTRWNVVLCQPTYEQLAVARPPILTPVSFESGQRHMVVIEAINSRGVQIADPVSGTLFLSREEFLVVYTGQVLLFEPRG
ncbi:MAG: cysteine peptidase family C39 domain-containing protein [Phycisphaeraceae bacterium]